MSGSTTSWSLASRRCRAVRASPIAWPPPGDALPDSFLISLQGAMGDVLLTTPVAARLRKEHPDARIGVRTQHGYVYRGNPDIDYVVATLLDAAFGSREIDFEMAYETRRGMHQGEAFLDQAFGDNRGDKTIVLQQQPLPFALDWPKVIVLHPARSWPNRTLPVAFWQALCQQLTSVGWQPVVTGTLYDQR